jgi:hypothetical protein
MPVAFPSRFGAEGILAIAPKNPRTVPMLTRAQAWARVTQGANWGTICFASMQAFFVTFCGVDVAEKEKGE